jgi:hypothetical protein
LPPWVGGPEIWVKSGVKHHFSPKFPKFFLNGGNLR